MVSIKEIYNKFFKNEFENLEFVFNTDITRITPFSFGIKEVRGGRLKYQINLISSYEIGKEQKQLIDTIFEMYNLELRDETEFVMFGILHEIGHYMECLKRGTDMFIMRHTVTQEEMKKVSAREYRDLPGEQAADKFAVNKINKFLSMYRKDKKSYEELCDELGIDIL